MTKADVIVTWLEKQENFEAAPTEPRIPVAVASGVAEDEAQEDAPPSPPNGSAERSTR